MPGGLAAQIEERDHERDHARDEQTSARIVHPSAGTRCRVVPGDPHHTARCEPKGHVQQEYPPPADLIDKEVPTIGPRMLDTPQTLARRLPRGLHLGLEVAPIYSIADAAHTDTARGDGEVGDQSDDVDFDLQLPQTFGAAREILPALWVLRAGALVRISAFRRR